MLQGGIKAVHKNRLWHGLVVGLARHPRLPMATKAAAAAALAWVAVLPLGGMADDYPYYAPFGAVIAVSATVASSFKGSVQSICSILLGACLVFAVAQTPLPVVALLPIVVAAGVVLAGLRWLGPAGEWVPVSAVFVLIIGNTDRIDFATAYLGLTALGATIGIILNAAVPPLPLTSVADTLTDLREALADQLDDLAEGLRQNRPPAHREWEQRRRPIGPRARRMREVVIGASEARLANWRATRWREVSNEQVEHARSLQRLVLIVEDLTILVVDHEHEQLEQLEQLALGPELRAFAAAALECTAEVLRLPDDASDDVSSHDAAEEAVQELSTAIIKEQQRIGGDMFAAGAMVISLRQILADRPRRLPPRPLPHPDLESPLRSRRARHTSATR